MISNLVTEIYIMCYLCVSIPLSTTLGHPIRPMTPNVFTLWYRAPELILGYGMYLYFIILLHSI